MRKILIALLLLIIYKPVFSQQIKLCVQHNNISFRGLSVVNNNIVWVSGSNGTVGRSEDGGKTWKWMNVKGFEKTDFRDIEAFDSHTALIMAVDSPAYILRTKDGGRNWKIVFEDHTSGIFLDAMDFLDAQNGVVVGDPIKGHFFMVKTFDSGKSWEKVATMSAPVADTGEACFAASGTNIWILNNSNYAFVTGGKESNFVFNDQKIRLPLLQGKESTGANSFAEKNNKTLVVVGGDFLKANDTIGNCAISKDGGKTWQGPQTSPSGYRSCVEYLSESKWITCGLNGVDISNDDGMDWTKISDESFHVCRKAKNGKAVYFAGAGGRIAKLEE
ncbi:MAG: WD40/YVTN/BNR-like repeat-containing protein [Ginsengibacter sp.]